MALIDEVEIRVIGGSGGKGCCSFRREKYVPYGGPNGGNGGRGGSVYLEATDDKTSLLDFKYQPKYQAERGEHGMGKEMDGRGGEDLVLKVPLGTLVYDQDTGLLLADLIEHGQVFECAHGGRGGKGNRMFATSTNRAPRTTTPGDTGEERQLRLELRLLADVGLVGLPNAGKSTFLRSVSNARPKAADYPFTTLAPHLGVVNHKDQTFVVADLPGLIEGAASGAGLGHQFLRHVSRNRLLLHLVSIDDTVEAVATNVAVIEAELMAYDKSLMDLPRILLITKIDLLDAEARAEKLAQLKAAGVDGLAISAVTSEGMSVLLDKLAAAAPAWRSQDVAGQSDSTLAPVSAVDKRMEMQEGLM